jgi:predicted nucleic acid-binding protein
MPIEPAAYVLDSYALLAYLEGEAGMPRVRDVLSAALQGKPMVYVSLINLGEALYITEREKGLTKAHQAMAAVDQLPLQVVPVSRATVLSAAHIKAHYVVSYADAFAVVTAEEYNAVILTGDPEFKAMAQRVAVEWLPRR